MNTVSMQDAFVTLTAQVAPDGWHRLFIHYEHYPCEHGLFEKSTSRVWIGEIEDDLDLSLDAIDMLVALKEEMSKSAKSPWTWVEVSIQKSGKYSFDYKYGVPPLTAKSLRYASSSGESDA